MGKDLFEICDFSEEYLDYFFKIHKENFIDYFISHYGKWDDKRQFRAFKRMVESGNYKMIKFEGEVIGLINYQHGTTIMEMLIQKKKKDKDFELRPAVFRYLNIDKRFQGNGIATTIIKQIIDECKDCAITLKVFKDNPKAQKLYEKFGFLIDDSVEDKDYYTMNWTRTNLSQIAFN